MRFHGLQVVRFAAALSVVLFHAGVYARQTLRFNSPLVELLNAPILGSAVYLFFTLSGFVIAHSLTTLPPRRFLLLRAVRLYPAYWGAALAALIARYLIFGDVPHWGKLFNGLLLLPGRDPARFVLGVEWSLVFEVMFYIVFALLALGGRRAILIGMSVWALACGINLVWDPFVATTSLPSLRGILVSGLNLYFIAGVVTYRFRDYGRRLRPYVPLVVPMFVAGGVSGLSYALAHLSFVAAAAITIWYAAGSIRWKKNDALVQYGDLTYGLYLLHAPIIVICDTLAHFQFLLDPNNAFVLFTAAFALCLGSGYGVAEAAAYRFLRRRLFEARRVDQESPDRLAAAA